MKLIQMEQVTTQTLLGIQFWDPVIHRPVSEGLQVKAQRLSKDRTSRLGRVVLGRSTPSGVISFFGLTQEELVENDPQKQIWEKIPPSRPVAIDVEDKQSRYLPMSFVAEMPYRGAFKGRSSNWLITPLLRPIPKEGEERGVYLWSAPSRPIPGSLAVIRAQIAIGDGENPDPAAYALVEVAKQGKNQSPSYFGMTDKNGSLLLPFSYPPVPPPPKEGNFKYPSLGRQQFQLSIMVRYESNHRNQLPDSTLPNLETILLQKHAKIITQQYPKKLPDSMEVNLQFAQPLILRTMKTIEQPDSYLRIEPK